LDQHFLETWRRGYPHGNVPVVVVVVGKHREHFLADEERWFAVGKLFCARGHGDADLPDPPQVLFAGIRFSFSSHNGLICAPAALLSINAVIQSLRLTCHIIRSSHSMSKNLYSPSGPAIVAQAPCRADLAGGTIDLWPLYLFHPGAMTLNFAVNILTTCRVTPLRGRNIHLRSLDTKKEEHFESLDDVRARKKFRLPITARLLQFFAPKEGVLIETDSESPAGAGISGSSALMIAATAALARFTDRNLTLEQMRVIAQNVEAQIIAVPTGCQDYYPALYGGVSAIRLDADGIHREAVPIMPEEIESRFVLAYTGAPRKSGINNWEVFKLHINGDRRVFRNFERIAAIARSMHQALVVGDWDGVARLLREEWKLRRTNAPGITTPLIDKLVAVADKHGGRAAKVCGAGGGGCVIFLVEKGAASRVATAIGDAGARVLPLQVARDGLRLPPTRG
jgi:D-glycero-alpha-D-manno-heptose-7-phosphate kinase